MLQEITKRFEAVLHQPKHLPCVSIIIPFDPKMTRKATLCENLTKAYAKVEDELLQNYTGEKATTVLNKLQQAIKTLSYTTHKISIAIFVSPLIEKVYYLDIAVEEKIIIDDSFEIRDLIYCKKQFHKYLLVVLSTKNTKIFLGNGTQFVKILSNTSENAAAYKKDAPEKIANFSDANKIKEVLLDKFLHHTDKSLTLLLQAYKLPLFVMGTAKTIGHFKAITHNTSHTIEYIIGNYDEKKMEELQVIMEPYLTDWNKIMQTELLQEIDESISKRKIAIGIQNVWKCAAEKRGRLLVVEKNFFYPAQQGSSPEIIYPYNEIQKTAFYIKDAVDDIIEKVLASGGDVQFVEEGLLTKYDKIVLLEYY
jgi:hypothetical protein